MHDPCLSDWENTVENARTRENELRSIEARYPPPDQEEEDE